MKIGNPQDINGNPLLINIEVDSNYIIGNGTVSSALTFAGFPAVDSNEQVIISKAKQVKAGTGIFFSSSANELIINANPATDISSHVVRVINSNSMDNKVPTAKSVYNYVNSNFIKLQNGKIDNSLIDKSDSSTYGIVKIGSGISVSSGIISVPVIVSNLANNVNNPVAGKVIYSALNEKINKPSTGGQLGKVLSFKNNLQTVWIEQVKVPGSVSRFPQNLGNAGQILKVNNNANAVEWSDLQQITLDNQIVSNGSNAVAGSVIYSYVNSHTNNSSIHVPSGGNSGQILTKTNNSIVWADQIKVDEQIISGSNNAVAGKAVYESMNGKIDKPSMINGAGYVLTVNASENGFELNPIDNTLNENSVHAIQNKTVYSALESKVDLDLLNNYATSLEFDINNNNYVISAVLKHNDDILTSKTIDLPLQTMVISAYYQSATKNLILTLKNNETVSCSVEDIIDGLVSENRTINGKSLNADINLYGTDIKINDQINAKTIYESLNEKGDMFLSDYVNQGGQGIVLSAHNASRAQIANYASNVDWINVNNKPNEFNPSSHNHEVEEINDFDNNVSSIVSGMVQNISASIAQIASSAGHAEIAQFASSAGYAQKVGQHNHSAVQIIDFTGNVSSIVSGMVENISANIASNANYASSAGYIDWINIDNKPIATSSSLGLIIIGSGLSIDEFGVVNVEGTINISEEIQLGVVNNSGQFQPLSFEGTSSVESGDPQNVESYKSWNIPEGYGIYQNKTFDLTASNNNYITWSGTVATIQHNMNCIPIITIYNNNLKQVFLSAEIKTANTVDIDFEEIINGTWKIIFSYGCSFN